MTASSPSHGSAPGSQMARTEAGTTPEAAVPTELPGAQWPVGVVGSGTMGAGIAEVAARAGCSVIVLDISEHVLDGARERISHSLQRAESKGALAEPMSDILHRIRWTTERVDLAGVRVAVEAVRESLPDKQEVFHSLEGVVGEDVILASNTSSIPIAQLGAVVQRPGRLLGMHFFNPVPAMPLVEIVPSLLSAEETVQQATTFVTEVLGKDAVRAKDQAGFLVNALLVPYLLSAIRALQNGLGTREEIDAGMVGGCGMPLGPLALCDLIGLDVLLQVGDSLYAEHREPSYVSPPMLRRLVDAGHLGRKSGSGFFSY
ncbi:MAG: 3-hydroxybutyryl-CoA dehydrogenase [Nostocoides sp.]